MANKKLYEAHFIGQDDVEVVNVDMTCLPYDKINNLNKLYIEEDVNMGKGNKQPLPDMSNVVIHGAFDCSKWTITSDTVLPSGITELNCAHSIANLGVLIGLLDSTVQRVIIRPALFTNIKNNIDGALECAQNFVARYPNIVVIDDKQKQTLLNVLKDVSQSKSNETVKQNIPKPKKEVVAEKTADWLDRAELEQICVASPLLGGLLNDEELERYIRMAMSDKSGIKINKSSRLRADGVKVVCVHRDDVDAILNFMIEKYNENSQKRTATSKPKEKSGKKPDNPREAKPVDTTVSQKLFVNNKEISEVSIEKYIPESILGQLALNDQITLLQEIAKVNVHPFELNKQQVHYIENGKIIRLPNLEFKNARVLSQKIQPRDNRRIVWYMDGNKFYAVYYFAKHDKSHWYNLTLQADNAEIDVVIDFVKKNIADAKEKGIDISVNGWLQRLSAYISEKETTANKTDVPKQNTGKRSEKTVAESVPKQPAVEPEKIETSQRKLSRLPKDDLPVQSVSAQPVEHAVVEQSVTEPVAVKRTHRRFKKPIDLSHLRAFRDGGVQVEDYATVMDNFLEQEKQYHIATLLASEMNLHWNDVDEMHAEFTVRYETCKTLQQKLISSLSTETDTEKMLVATDKLQRVLKQKQFYEKALAKLNGFKSELNQMQQEYSKIK